MAFVWKNYCGRGILFSILAWALASHGAGAPYATTQPAREITGMEAVLTGMATANQADTRAWFEWGTSTNYQNQTAPVDIGDGNGVVWVTNQLTGLDSTLVYHCRLVASNSVGVACGADQAFTAGKRLWMWSSNLIFPPSSFLPYITNFPAGLTNVVAFALTDNPVGFGNPYTYPGCNALFLKSDGTVCACGENNSGQTNIPAGLHDIVAVAIGSDGTNGHSLALQKDGTVVAWGRSYNGITNVPADPPQGLSDVVAISAGCNHSLALKRDGSVVGWGYIKRYTNGIYVPNTSARFEPEAVPSGLSNVVAIAAGGNHSLALKNDGTIVAWGSCGYFETNTPGDVTNIVTIAAADAVSLALKSDGLVAGWGAFGRYGPQHWVGTNIAAISGYGLLLSKSGKCQGLLDDVPSAVSNLQAAAVASCGYYNLILADNARPVANSQWLNAFVDEDKVITFSGSDTNNDILSFKIFSLPTKGTLYQYDNGTRGAFISSTNTVVTDPLNRIWYASPSAVGLGLKFTFVANDGLTDSPPAEVDINVGAHAQAATLLPELVTPTTAVLAGKFTSLLSASGWWFEWGTTTQYGAVAASLSFSATNYSAMIATLTGLQPMTTYHFRAVADDNSGTNAYGDDVTFTTPFAIGKSTFAPEKGLHLEFEGASNTVFSVWASTNLADWFQVGASVESAPGVFQFDAPPAPQQPVLFYRVCTP